uniref:MKL/myocardin-like protein 2 n=2 Tax=Lygus hesperus TaxID=30085 RepID=A0A0A9WAD4_LYGHE
MEPNAQVDDSPLHSHMDKNKESLKVKLMLRRPINQLVAQGIMPPLKTPPGFHEQRQKLERAKMGDLLKAKIQQRPDREELVRQHILEDVGHVDPSLAEKQRQLKKCRLADQLNDQLSHRPGPLELIKKNILHTEPPIERAIKEGAIEFKATSEGTATKPTHPDHYMLDEDSGGSLSPPPSSLGTQVSSPSSSITQASTPVVISSGDEAQVTSTTNTLSSASLGPNGGIVTVLLTPSTAIAIPAVPYRAPTSSVGAQVSSSASASPSPAPSPAPSQSKDKSRKKSKAKATSKPRTIKFHEYKGPPNAQKNASQNASSAETSYDLLLQQQQLFLQWQLEWQHKYPQILLPASRRPTTPPLGSASSSSSNAGESSSNAPPPPPLPQSSPPPPLRNLEDMKVSDLKAELKKRNLPVSGSKPQLIERLKPFCESAQQHQQQQQQQAAANAAQQQQQAHAVSSTTSHQEESIPSVCSVSSSGQTQPSSILMDTSESPLSPPSELHSPASVASSQIPLAIVKIEPQLSSQIQQNTFQQQPNAKASLAAFLQQQQLNHQLLSQQQLLANNNNNNNNNNVVIKQEPNTQTRSTCTLPNFAGTFMNGSTNGSNDILSQADTEAFIMDNAKGLFDVKPSDLNKLNLQNQLALQNDDPMLDVKSQIVDDVLEILIKNGELPASAAAQPLELSELDMDVDHSDLMEVDTEWLDSLISETNNGLEHHSSRNDPLLCAAPCTPPSFDLFIDDPDFKVTGPLSDWDHSTWST